MHAQAPLFKEQTSDTMLNTLNAVVSLYIVNHRRFGASKKEKRKEERKKKKKKKKKSQSSFSHLLFTHISLSHTLRSLC